MTTALPPSHFKISRTRAYAALIAMLLLASMGAALLLPVHATNGLNPPVLTCQESFDPDASLGTYTFATSAGNIFHGDCSQFTQGSVVYITVTTFSYAAYVTSVTDNNSDTYLLAGNVVNGGASDYGGALISSGQYTSFTTQCYDSAGMVSSGWYSNVISGNATAFTVALAATAPNSNYPTDAYFRYIEVDVSVFSVNTLYGVAGKQGLGSELQALIKYPNSTTMHTPLVTYTSTPFNIPADSAVVASSITNYGSCEGSSSVSMSQPLNPLTPLYTHGNAYIGGYEVTNASQPNQVLSMKVADGFGSYCNVSQPIRIFPPSYDCGFVVPINLLFVVLSPSGEIVNTGGGGSTSIGNGGDNTLNGTATGLVANETYLFQGTTSTFGGTITALATNIANVTLTGTSDPKVWVAMTVYETSQPIQANGTTVLIGNLNPVSAQNPLNFVVGCVLHVSNHAGRTPFDCLPSGGLLNNTVFAIGLIVQHSGVFIDSTVNGNTLGLDTIDPVNGAVVPIQSPITSMRFTNASVYFTGLLVTPNISVTTTLTNTLTTTTSTTTTTCLSNCSSVTITFSTTSTSVQVIQQTINAPGLSAFDYWLIPLVFTFVPVFLTFLIMFKYDYKGGQELKIALSVGSMSGWAAWSLNHGNSLSTFMPIVLPLSITFMALLAFIMDR